MDRMELVRALRADTQTHYNCCQSVLIPFAQEMGLTKEQVFALGAYFGGGVRHGSVCGALAGAMMALGALGYSEEDAQALLRHFRQTHGATDCASLLRASHDRGETKKAHCDGLVFEMTQYLSQLVDQGKNTTES